APTTARRSSNRTAWRGRSPWPSSAPGKAPCRGTTRSSSTAPDRTTRRPPVGRTSTGPRGFTTPKCWRVASTPGGRPGSALPPQRLEGGMATTSADRTATAPVPAPARTVVACYSVFDHFFPRCGLLDLSEGIYDAPDTTYEQAQRNQHRYLLDQAGCAPGRRVLDVGCGSGPRRARARRRGARGVGITVSAAQARHGRRAGLDVRLADYKALGPDWDGSFDAVIANGSAEHFVQPADAAAGRADEIYRHFFATAHRLIDPASPARRLVTTAIHFVRRPDPADLLRSPLALRPRSDAFHYALLARSLPLRGAGPQLRRLVPCPGAVPPLRRRLLRPGRGGERDR